MANGAEREAIRLNRFSFLPGRVSELADQALSEKIFPGLVVIAPTCGCRFAPTCSHYAREALPRARPLGRRACALPRAPPREVRPLAPRRPRSRCRKEMRAFPRIISLTNRLSCLARRERAVTLHLSLLTLALSAMDKKNTAIGVLLLVAAMASFYVSSRYAPPPTKPVITTTLEAAARSASNDASPSGPAAWSPTPPSPRRKKSAAPAEYLTLSNGYVAVKFTTAGGAIDTIALGAKKAALGHDDPYVINDVQAEPGAGLLDYPGSARTPATNSFRRRAMRSSTHSWSTVSSRSPATTPCSAEPTAILTRSAHETIFRNLTASALALPPQPCVSVRHHRPARPIKTRGIFILVGYSTGR